MLPSVKGAGATTTGHAMTVVTILIAVMAVEMIVGTIAAMTVSLAKDAGAV